MPTTIEELNRSISEIEPLEVDIAGRIKNLTPLSIDPLPEADHGKVYDTAIKEDIDFDEAETYLRIQEIPDPDSVSDFPVDFEVGLEDEESPYAGFDVEPEKPTGQKIKEWFSGKPEDVTLPEPIGRAEKLDVAIKKTGRPIARTFYKFAKGKLLGTPEIGWALVKKATGDKFPNVKDKSLDEAIDWALDYNPSGFMRTIGEMAEFAGGVQTARNFLGTRPKGSTLIDRSIERFNVGAGQKLAREVSNVIAEGVDPEADRPIKGPAEALKEGAWLVGLGALGDSYSWAKNTTLGMAVEEKLNWELLKIAAKYPTFSQAMDFVRKNPSDHFIKQALRTIKKNGESLRNLPKESWAAIKHMARFKEMQLRQMFNLTPIEQIIYPAPKVKALLPPPSVAEAIKTGGITKPTKPTVKPVTQPQGAVEAVGQAAIRLKDGTIVTGETHGEAYNKANLDELAEQALSSTTDPHPEVLEDLGIEDGWVTSTGRFVGREEASRIRNKSEVVRELSEKLHAEVATEREMQAGEKAFEGGNLPIMAKLQTAMFNWMKSNGIDTSNPLNNSVAKMIWDAGVKGDAKGIQDVIDNQIDSLPEESRDMFREYATTVMTELSPQPQGAEKKPAEPKKGAIQKFIENEDGFVDFSPLETAGPQVRSLAEKGSQVITRFTGLEKPVQQVMIEYEEQLREIPKFAAQEGMDKFGHLSEADERLVEDYQERKDLNPGEFKEFPDELKQVHREMVKAYDEIGERLEGLGFGANWPKSQIEYLEEKKARLESNDDVDVDEITAIQDAIDVLEQVGYVHHSYLDAPVSKKIKRWFGKRISDKPTGLLGRKFPTFEAAEKEGFKRASLAASYADALETILRAEEAHRLIAAINNNPDLSAWENEAPDDWEILDERAFPSSVSRSNWVDDEGKTHTRTKRRKYPAPVVDALEELTYSRGQHPLELAYDKFNMFMKLVGFYNPVFMPMYDMQQMWRAVGVKGSIYLPKAWKIFREKGEEFHKLRKGGLFNNVVNWVPAAQSLAQEMIDQARLTDDAKVKALILKYANPLNYMQNLRAVQQATTWTADEVIRISAYEAFKDSPAAQGLTEFEKIEYVNDAMVNYAKLPKETKRWLNKLFFVPNYRIGNFRFFWSQLAKHPKRFRGAMARTFGWKLFVKYGLPAMITSILVAAGSRKRAYSEKGYKMIIYNPDTNTDTVYSIGGPLLEGQKLTQRNLRQSFDFNLAALPHLGYRILTGPRRGQTDDVIGEFFKLGTPIWRDIVTAKGKDRKPVEKVLTLMALAYTYQRQHKDKVEDDAIPSALKMLSVWTDWREQGEDIKRIVQGKTGYFGPGGEFDRLLREFEVKKDRHQGKIDKEITRMFRQGDDKGALTYAFEEKRFKSADGFSGRYIRAHAPLVYFWETMPPVEQAEFLVYLKNNGYDIDTSKVKSIKTLKDALPQDMKDYMEQQIIDLGKSRNSK